MATCAASAMLSAAALAQPVSGPYISLGAGISLQHNETQGAAPSLGLPDSTQWQFNPGFAAQVSFGWGFGNGLRLDVDVPYITNKVSGTSVAGQRAGGSEGKYGGMVNLMYDFNVGLPVVPYVGIGAGGIDVERDGFNRSYSDFTFPGRITGQTVGDFGYQGIVGLAYPLPSVPGLAMTAEYRFLGVVDSQSSLTTTVFNSNGSVLATGSTRVTGDFNHSLMLGLRFSFAGPGTPAPLTDASDLTGGGGGSVPMAEPARTYLVFFDWDRADLSARARQIVAEAATASTHVQTTRIDVNGYTDLSGSAEYNQRLSLRRAQSVEAELVRDGVPKDVISVVGHGESNPLVPTAAGVREPQNRRVEIILQ